MGQGRSRDGGRRAHAGRRGGVCGTLTISIRAPQPGGSFAVAAPIASAPPSGTQLRSTEAQPRTRAAAPANEPLPGKRILHHATTTTTTATATTISTRETTATTAGSIHPAIPPTTANQPAATASGVRPAAQRRIFEGANDAIDANPTRRFRRRTPSSPRRQRLSAATASPTTSPTAAAAGSAWISSGSSSSAKLRRLRGFGGGGAGAGASDGPASAGRPAGGIPGQEGGRRNRRHVQEFRANDGRSLRPVEKRV